MIDTQQVQTTVQLLRRLPVKGITDWHLRALVDRGLIEAPTKFGRNKAWPSDQAFIDKATSALIEAGYVIHNPSPPCEPAPVPKENLCPLRHA